MKRLLVNPYLAVAAVAIVTVALVLLSALPGHAQDASPLGGIWMLNPSLTEAPHEIGFNADWAVPSNGAGPPASSGGGGGGGGRGRRGSGGGGSRGSGGGSVPRESWEDSQRRQILTAEVRKPPARLIIVDTAAAIIITNELGQSRTFHPEGNADSIQLEGVPTPVTAKRDHDRLVILYHVEEHRDLQYTFTRATTPPQLIVDVQFLERGGGDKVHFVYEPGGGRDGTPSGTVAASLPNAPAGPGGVPAAPASGPASDNVDTRPGAELSGLKNLGIVVEDLGSQATACGLNHDAIETALSKRLSGAGLVVRKNSDEDTYLYVNVMTTTVSGGTCVSRYDAYLYTHATAKLAYRERPALVQVSLMHRGAMGGSASGSHPATVLAGLESLVDLFITQIRDANK